MKINDVKEKIKKILKNLSKRVNSEKNRFRPYYKFIKRNDFEEKKYNQSIYRNKSKRVRKPKDILTFKGSGYNGKGSVNTDATYFRKSRG